MDKGKGERKRPDFPSDDRRSVAAELFAHGISRDSFAYRDHLRDATKMIARLKSRGPGTARTIKPEYPYCLYVQKTCVQITVGVLLANDYFYATEM